MPFRFFHNAVALLFAGLVLKCIYCETTCAYLHGEIYSNDLQIKKRRKNTFLLKVRNGSKKDVCEL